MNESFQNSLEHLLVEMKRMELKLHLQVIKLRQGSAQTADEKFRGLYISDDEIDKIMGSLPFQLETSSYQTDNSAVASLAQSLKQLEEDIVEREKESLRRGLTLRLSELRRLFHLSKFDIDVILACILPELDLKYQKLYAYLQDDVTKKSPTVDLMLHLLCDSFEHRLKARQAFSPEAPLIKHHLLRIYDDHSQRKTPLLTKFLQIDERISSYLLGSGQIDSRLLSFVHLRHPEVKLQDVILPNDTKHLLTQLASYLKETAPICYFKGGYGVGKQSTAVAICHELGVPLLCIDINHMLSSDISLGLSVSLIFREGRLQNAALYLNGYDILFSDEKGSKSGYGDIIPELESYLQWVFLAGEKGWQPRGVLDTKPFINIEFPIPPYSARKQLWERHWPNGTPLAADVDLSDLASKFRLSGGQINDAMAMARSLSLWRDPENGQVTNKDLYSACRQQSGYRLNTLAQQIYPQYHWDDIILPRDQKELLLEICSYVKHYHTVYDNWGFGRKLSRGKGLNILFAGPSGTGKTMAAEIMANELGLDLYKIDLSAIVSKYIGETEKNLDRIFQEGQNSNAILFFDEADALFGKRSEVRDSHDRYANIEIAYLLQKMEVYEGMVILATNLRKNMDEAFARRMHFTLEFPIPEEADRYRIWQGIFPREAPLKNSIDLTFMAKQFKITGGNIKNIALSAAFLAAENGGNISMENLIRGTKREYQKMGKLCTEGDFAHYFELVKS
jgi:ATP-dependent 26S proteasome regulatory subunit